MTDDNNTITLDQARIEFLSQEIGSQAAQHALERANLRVQIAQSDQALRVANDQIEALQTELEVFKTAPAFEDDEADPRPRK